MKKVAAVLLMIGLTIGCAKVQRTGSICLEPFATAGFKTTNPVDIKIDTVEAIRDQIPAWFKRRIEEESLIKFVDDCSQADYKITGRLTQVDTAMQGGSYINPWTGGRNNYSQRSFGIGIVCTAKNLKTAEVISEYDGYKHRKNLDDSLEDLAYDFLHTIDTIPTK